MGIRLSNANRLPEVTRLRRPHRPGEVGGSHGPRALGSRLLPALWQPEDLDPKGKMTEAFLRTGTPAYVIASETAL